MKTKIKSAAQFILSWFDREEEADVNNNNDVAICFVVAFTNGFLLLFVVALSFGIPKLLLWVKYIPRSSITLAMDTSNHRNTAFWDGSVMVSILFTCMHALASMIETQTPNDKN